MFNFSMMLAAFLIFSDLIGYGRCFAVVLDEAHEDEGAGVPDKDACSNKSLYSDDFLKILADTKDSCYNVIDTKRIDECERLHKGEGFVNDDKRAFICQLECAGYRRMCSLFKPKDDDDAGFEFNDRFDELFNSSMTYIKGVFNDYDPDIGFDENDIFADVEIDTFMKFMWKTWPLLLTLIPLLLNQYAYYNFWGYACGMLVMLCVYTIVSFTYVEAAYNVFIWTMCLVSETGKNPLRDFTVSYGLIIASTFLCFIVKGWTKFFSGFTVMFIYSFYVYVTFIKKSNGVKGTGVAMFIAHLVLMYEQLQRLNDFLHMDAFSFTVVRAIINVVLPNGRSGYLVYNVIDIAYTMVKYVALDYKISCWIVSIIIQLLCFVAIRCLFGVYVINALRFKANFRSYFTGGLLYSSGIFDGIAYVWATALGDEIISSRRMAYSMVNVLMMWFELRCAREFFVLRVFIFVSDSILWSSVYSNAPRYLDMNIDMKRIAYPQDCASVWVSMAHMNYIAKHVKKLHVVIDRKNYSGLGFVNRHSDPNKATVLSIDHVGNCSSLRMDGVVYTEPLVTKMSGASDPIVSIELSPYEGDSCKGVGLLTADEVYNIKQVVISSLSDGEDEPMMVFSSEFNIDSKGDLRILSCLQEGDSGGPVFAALKDGSIRYAGAVSRTSDVRGKGHKFAFVTTASGVRHDSDSDGGSPVRNSNKAAIDFNRQRNRNSDNLTNLCNAQEKLMTAVDRFAHWVVDAATVDGYKWVPDDDGSGAYEYHEGRKPDDFGERKRGYDKKRKVRTMNTRHNLDRVKDLSDVVFSNSAERSLFMQMVQAGHEFNYVPGTVVHFVDGAMMVDDNPDPRDYSFPH